MVEFRIIALSGFITIGSLCAVFWLTKQLVELLLDVLSQVDGHHSLAYSEEPQDAFSPPAWWQQVGAVPLSVVA